RDMATRIAATSSRKASAMAIPTPAQAPGDSVLEERGSCGWGGMVETPVTFGAAVDEIGGAVLLCVLLCAVLEEEELCAVLLLLTPVLECVLDTVDDLQLGNHWLRTVTNAPRL